MIDTHKWKQRLKELKHKKLATSEDISTLTKMINSKDEENHTVLDVLVSNIIKNKLSESLNAGQKQAFETIIDFLIDSEDYKGIVLKGYAGTGKTFLVRRLIEYIAQTDHKGAIAITAPTNKAVKVLYKAAAGNNSGLSSFVFEDIFDGTSRISYSTIHKLLGMREVIAPDGTQTFEMQNINENKSVNFKYLIVDEISMLDNVICHGIMKLADKIKIIFIGDPMQIPPVNATDSIPFKHDSPYKYKTVELTEIMRQKGDNPIIASSFTIRDNISMTQPIPKLVTKVNDKGEGLIYFDESVDKPKIKPLLEQYFKNSNFELNSDYMKVIAWTNKTVNYINDVVREILYGKNPAKFEEGEKLIVLKPIFKEFYHKKKYGHYWRLFLNTSEELTVTNVHLETLTKKIATHSLTYSAWVLTVSYSDLKGNDCEDFIYVIHESSEEDYHKMVSTLRKRAIDHKLSNPETRKKAWVDYFNCLKWSAQTAYNYAITGHKAQGSTYENVLIIEDDIDRNRKTLERNRIKYTAYSRASKLLHILRKN